MHLKSLSVFVGVFLVFSVGAMGEENVERHQEHEPCCLHHQCVQYVYDDYHKHGGYYMRGECGYHKQSPEKHNSHSQSHSSHSSHSHHSSYCNYHGSCLEAGRCFYERWKEITAGEVNPGQAHFQEVEKKEESGIKLQRPL